MSSRRVVIVGGGAAGFFAAIACGEAASQAEITLLERSPQFLTKVRISGGGRCNVTHACFEEREFSTYYPRGERALIGLLKRFHARDTVNWFESRGVKLKIEEDGRMFPITDSSKTIIDCLLQEAGNVGVKMFPNRGVERVVRTPGGAFEVTLANGEIVSCDRILLAIGGLRTSVVGRIATELGHTVEPPVPSLFTFHVAAPWLRELSGVAVNCAVSIPGTELREQCPMLITHWGLSGPAILRLSAWGARILHEKNYQFLLHINWLPGWNAEKLTGEFQSRRDLMAARFLVNAPIAPLPVRLWEKLVVEAGIAPETRWAALSRQAQHALTQQLTRTELRVTGKSLNKDEFVTCGGVRLSEVDLKTMQSKICPGLFFAGEVLDIDGVTGGFNFQAAWTTGWIAGKAMAESLRT